MPYEKIIIPQSKYYEISVGFKLLKIFRTINLLSPSCAHVCMYIWGFRARKHLRSLAPVMNDDDNDGQMIFGDIGA